MTMLSRESVNVPEELARWMEVRGWVYQLLVDFLGRPPRMSLIAQWRSRLEHKQIIPVCQGGKRLQEYLERIPEDALRRVCAEETEEFKRLFAGHDAKVQTRESLYRARTEGVNGFACLTEVRDMYMDRGVVFNKISGEQDDSIAMELEFMAVMSEKMLTKIHLQESFKRQINAQIHFLENHLLKWVPAFSADLRAATSSSLYMGLVELLNEFLTMDLEQLHRCRRESVAEE